MNKNRLLLGVALLTLAAAPAMAGMSSSTINSADTNTVQGNAQVQPAMNNMDAPPPQGEMQRGPGGPQGGPGGPGHGQRFANADTNGDGFLSKEEMQAAQQKRLDMMFQKNDADKDGQLSKQELRQGRQEWEGKMRQHMGQRRGGPNGGGQMGGGQQQPQQ